MKKHEINIEIIQGYYAIVFRDKNGMSILAKTYKVYTADNLLSRFRGYFTEGRLLKPLKSAYNK